MTGCYVHESRCLKSFCDRVSGHGGRNHCGGSDHAKNGCGHRRCEYDDDHAKNGCDHHRHEHDDDHAKNGYDCHHPLPRGGCDDDYEKNDDYGDDHEKNHCGGCHFLPC